MIRLSNGIRPTNPKKIKILTHLISESYFFIFFIGKLSQPKG